MNIYILSPLINSAYEKLLKTNFKNVAIISTVSKIPDLTVLSGDDEKILVIDPDFVNWNVTASDLASVKNVKAILVNSTSFGWIDPAYLSQHHIPLVNIKDWCTQAVAEYAIMMALNLARKMPLVIKDNYVLNYQKYVGIQLKGKTAGIIGMGNIGTALGERLKGMGMHVIYWSNKSRSDLGKFVSLEELFQSSDLILPTMADNKFTQGLITDDLLKSTKSSALFVSIVHRYYNHDLLLTMVKEDKLGGYAFEDSTVKMTDFVGNVWVAPEYAWCTAESFENNDRKLLQNIKDVVSGDFSGRVN